MDNIGETKFNFASVLNEHSKLDFKTIDDSDLITTLDDYIRNGDFSTMLSWFLESPVGVSCVTTNLNEKNEKNIQLVKLNKANINLLFVNIENLIIQKFQILSQPVSTKKNVDTESNYKTNMDINKSFNKKFDSQKNNLDDPLLWECETYDIQKDYLKYEIKERLSNNLFREFMKLFTIKLKDNKIVIEMCSNSEYTFDMNIEEENTYNESYIKAINYLVDSFVTVEVNTDEYISYYASVIAPFIQWVTRTINIIPIKKHDYYIFPTSIVYYTIKKIMSFDRDFKNNRYVSTHKDTSIYYLNDEGVLNIHKIMSNQKSRNRKRVREEDILKYAEINDEEILKLQSDNKTLEKVKKLMDEKNINLCFKDVYFMNWLHENNDTEKTQEKHFYKELFKKLTDITFTGELMFELEFILNLMSSFPHIRDAYLYKQMYDEIETFRMARSEIYSGPHKTLFFSTKTYQPKLYKWLLRNYDYGKFQKDSKLCDNPHWIIPSYILLMFHMYLHVNGYSFFAYRFFVPFQSWCKEKDVIIKRSFTEPIFVKTGSSFFCLLYKGVMFKMNSFKGETTKNTTDDEINDNSYTIRSQFYRDETLKMLWLWFCFIGDDIFKATISEIPWLREWKILNQDICVHHVLNKEVFGITDNITKNFFNVKLHIAETLEEKRKKKKIQDELIEKNKKATDLLKTKIYSKK